MAGFVFYLWQLLHSKSFHPNCSTSIPITEAFTAIRNWCHFQLGFYTVALHLWIQADAPETLALPEPQKSVEGSNLSNVHCCIPWGHKAGFTFPSTRKPMVLHQLTRLRVWLGGGSKSHHKLMLVWSQAAQTSAPVKWHLGTHHHC